MEAGPVSLTRQGEIAVVTIDSPPVNALSAAVRAGILRAVAATEADPGVRAVVLICAGRTFIAGADITEFGRPPVEPHLPDVILALEATTRPWVAAIHGTALGGGLEVALGCHWRIAAPDARLGLPEVTLGLIPGAGGTVRLPRLVTPVEALAMIAEGKPIPAARAAEIGLIDAVADGELLPAALRFAAAAADRPLRVALSQRSAGPGANAAFDTEAARILARARGLHAPAEAVAALRDALNLPADLALACERRRFVALRDGPQSRALRYVFAAERAVARVPGLAGVIPLPSASVGVVGGGTMGAGIATAALIAGRAVTLIERDDAALERGLGTIRDNLGTSLKRGILDAARHTACLGRLSGAIGYEALAEADLVIEAVFEEMGVKQAVFAELDRTTRAEAILATNTSYLDVNAIAASVRDPSRVVGLHFFAPAHVMKLVEVIRTERLRDEVLATTLGFARDLGKIAVPSGVCDGFIGNRILTRYRQATDLMLLEGATPWEIDAAMQGFGMAMGPYAVQDLSGLDIAYANRKRLGLRDRPDWHYVPIADRMVDQLGRLGRKTGAGWYDYPAGAAPVPSSEVEALILDATGRSAAELRPPGPQAIVARAHAAMVAEAARILEEGIAARPSDIDLVLIHGYGFPRWRGGPLHHADRIGLAELVARIDGYAAADPRSWRVPALLRRLADEGRGFASLPAERIPADA